MKTSDSRPLIPQKEEHITEAKWVNWESLDIETLDTYASIKDLLRTVKQVK